MAMPTEMAAVNKRFVVIICI